MRYIKDLMIEKVVLNVIDSHADEAIITMKELKVNEVAEEFVRKHIVKSLKSNDTYKAMFIDDDGIAATHIREVINDPDLFMDVSQELTEYMFDTIKNSDIPSGDMLFVQYIADEQRCFAILKLDYQVSHMHNISHGDDEDELIINLISQEVGLPKMGQGLKKCAFFTKAPEDKIEMIVINKRQKIEDANEDYFIQDFLEAVIVSDDTDKTRKFKPAVEKWTQRNLSDQIGIAEQARAMINETLLSEDVVNVTKLSDNMFSELPEVKASFKESMADQGYSEDTEFGVDKTWVEKQMKTKVIKTDSGIVIKGEFDLFKDSQRFIVKQNGDGTCDYIIKNVRNITEK